MYHFLGQIVEKLLGQKYKSKIKKVLDIVFDIYCEIRLRRMMHKDGIHEVKCIVPFTRMEFGTEGWVRNCCLFISNRHVYSVIKRVIKDKLTYLEPSALIDLYNSVNEVKREKRDGIIIEAGCALGGSALVIASSKERTRAFYIYDVFGMIPPPSKQDGDDAHERYKTIASWKSKGIWGNGYYGYEENLLEKVKQIFHDYGLPTNENNVYLIKGLFENTLFVNEPVALAHIDCDWYEPVMVCLQRIEPHLVKGGVLVIDDYYTWSGCRKAVDAYFADKKDGFEFCNKSRLHIIRK